MLSESANILKSLVPLAVKAGEKILEIYNGETSAWKVETKTDNTPLTLADKHSNDIICRGLEQITPGIPIISEENKEIPYETRKNYSYFWLVDPLDGTREFLKRNGEFTINIALVRENKPVLGLVSIPCSNLIYYGMAGGGSFIMSKNLPARPVRAAAFSMSGTDLVIASSRSHMNEETQNYLSTFSSAMFVSKGSSLKFMMIAEGTAHIYPRFGRTMEWDTAASQIIVEEAGGTIVDCYSGQPLTYNKPGLDNPGFIAMGKLLTS